jgi:hypothetical protein
LTTLLVLVGCGCSSFLFVRDYGELSWLLTVVYVELACVPNSFNAVNTTMAIKTRINAYSTNPCPWLLVTTAANFRHIRLTMVDIVISFF